MRFSTDRLETVLEKCKTETVLDLIILIVLSPCILFMILLAILDGIHFKRPPDERW